MAKDQKETQDDDVADTQQHTSGNEDKAAELTTAESSELHDTSEATDTTKKESDTHTAESTGEGLAPTPKQKGRFAFFQPAIGWVRQHKILAGVLGSALVVVVIAAVVAATDARFAVMNLFGKATVEVVVVDKSSRQPVPKATVTIAGQQATSSDKGVARFDAIAYGHTELVVKKSAYAETKQSVTVTASPQKFEARVQPVGTKISLIVSDVLSAKAISAVKATYGSNDAVANSSGAIELIVPPTDKQSIEVTLAAPGYNTKKVAVAVNSQQNRLTLTPSGYIYFLSKRTGTIDVMKAQLDGSDAQTVLPGTGKESETETVLLASRDWKYLLLKASREGGKEKLYVIDTSNDSLRTVDEGKVNFYLAGWSGHTFVYRVYREEIPYGEPRQQAVKAFNADTQKLANLDESRVANGVAQYFGDVYIVNGGIVYSRSWSGFAGEPIELVFADTGGKQKVLRTYPSADFTSIALRAEGPDELYGVAQSNDYRKPSLVFEYAAGKVADSDENADQALARPYPTKLLSGGGKRTVWSEPRDGKNTVLIGNEAGSEGRDFVVLDEYAAYGWYGDEYVLLSKDGSELYARAVDAPGTTKPLKITDYHKPRLEYQGYGYGYGGL